MKHKSYREPGMHNYVRKCRDQLNFLTLNVVVQVDKFTITAKKV